LLLWIKLWISTLLLDKDSAMNANTEYTDQTGTGLPERGARTRRGALSVLITREGAPSFRLLARSAECHCLADFAARSVRLGTRRDDSAGGIDALDVSGAGSRCKTHPMQGARAQ